MKTGFIILLCLVHQVLFSQQLSDKDRLVLKKLTCDMLKADQAVRNSLHKARESHNADSITFFYKELQRIDSNHFHILDSIIHKIGYPSQDMLGKGSCDLVAILIHWSKEYPSWFNDPKLVKTFKREIENGNLSVAFIDLAHFFYISYMDADIKLMPLVNNARVAYGLMPYTTKQYTKQEWVEPMRDDSEEERRKHGIRIGTTHSRNSGQ